MPISDDEVRALLESNARIEAEQKRHGRTLYGDDEGEWKGLRALVLSIKTQLDALDGKITGYEDRVRGAKWVVGGIVFLITSSAIAALINALGGG